MDSHAIPADVLHQEWMADPTYRREYEALEEEFTLAAAIIEARPGAHPPDGV